MCVGRIEIQMQPTTLKTNTLRTFQSLKLDISWVVWCTCTEAHKMGYVSCTPYCTEYQYWKEN